MSSQRTIIQSEQMPSHSLKELVSYVYSLQSHMACRRSGVPVSARVARGVLEAIRQALPHAKMFYWGYLSTVLSVDCEKNSSRAIMKKYESIRGPIEYCTFEYFLRAAIEVLKSIPSIPDTDLAAIARGLQPTLDRYHEDRLCDLFDKAECVRQACFDNLSRTRETCLCPLMGAVKRLEPQPEKLVVDAAQRFATRLPLRVARSVLLGRYCVR